MQTDANAIQLEIEVTYRVARSTSILLLKPQSERSVEDRRFLRLKGITMLADDPNDATTIRRKAAAIFAEATEIIAAEESKGSGLYALKYTPNREQPLDRSGVKPLGALIHRLAIKHGLIRSAQRRKVGTASRRSSRAG